MWRQLYKAVLLVSLVTTPLAALDTTLVSQTLDAPIPWDIADDISGTPFVTADGQTAIFTSSASNLIPGQQSNPFSKPYRWNAASDEVTPIGVEPNADITPICCPEQAKSVRRWVRRFRHRAMCSIPLLGNTRV